MTRLEWPTQKGEKIICPHCFRKINRKDAKKGLCKQCHTFWKEYGGKVISEKSIPSKVR